MYNAAQTGSQITQTFLFNLSKPMAPKNEVKMSKEHGNHYTFLKNTKYIYNQNKNIDLSGEIKKILPSVL